MYRRSIIKSIQRGTVSTTATITAVVVANSFVRFIGQSNSLGGGSTDLRQAASRLTLTNSTTVTASHTGTAANSTVSFEVIEFVAGIVKSRTEATITITAGNTTATYTSLPSVNVSKTILVYAGHTTTDDGSGGLASATVRADLTNTTTVTATRGGTTNQVGIGFTAMEMF